MIETTRKTDLKLFRHMEHQEVVQEDQEVLEVLQISMVNNQVCNSNKWIGVHNSKMVEMYSCRSYVKELMTISWLFSETWRTPFQKQSDSS